MSEKLKKLEKILGYNFKRPELLIEAMTHSSYKGDGKSSKDNERLEFLGDAVIELAVSEELFRFFDKLDEGKLTKIRSGIVSRKSLGKKAVELNLGEFILLGEGEIKNNGRINSTILSNFFEALIGAIFLDSNYDTTKKIISEILIEDISKYNISKKQDKFKSKLQEEVQRRFHIIPKYFLKEKFGPEHDSTFIMEVYLDKKKFGEGIGKNKREAEEKAAEEAYEKLKENNFEL